MKVQAGQFKEEKWQHEKVGRLRYALIAERPAGQESKETTMDDARSWAGPDEAQERDLAPVNELDILLGSDTIRGKKRHRAIR